MSLLKSGIQSATAFAPATCANVAVGFDILGFALEDVGDAVTLTRRDDHQIIIETINTTENLPFAINKNTASIGLLKLCQDLNIETGFSLTINKGIPLSSGMGGSAASAVAALVAFNAFLEKPLSSFELANYALLGEELASGQQHPDNIVPCIFGGMTLIHSMNPIGLVQLPIPDVYCVLIHPHLQVSTKDARSVLKEHVSLKDFVKQSANLAAFISALYENNLTLLKKSLSDIIVEPQRSQFVPGFNKIKAAALKAGALGASFSGSGPSIFALAATKNDAEAISNAMSEQLTMKADTWISRISHEAAHITEIS